VDVSLKSMRYVIGAYVILYTLHVEMDTITHSKLGRPN
jgi:hypothetical protein